MGRKTFTSTKAQAHIDAILAMIEERGAAQVSDVMELLSLRYSVANDYMNHIAREMLLICETDTAPNLTRGKPAKRWKMGVDPAFAALSIENYRRSAAPAVQVGMWRDGLVAALFGDVGEVRV